MTPLFKKWIIGLLAALFLGSLLFNAGLRNTILRRRAVRQAEKELAALSAEVEFRRGEISKLKNNPQLYEDLVRKDLEYLRPGEKEVRFMKRDGTAKP